MQLRSRHSVAQDPSVEPTDQGICSAESGKVSTAFMPESDQDLSSFRTTLPEAALPRIVRVFRRSLCRHGNFRQREDAALPRQIRIDEKSVSMEAETMVQRLEEMAVSA
jgi:hypothetical protein